MIGIAKMFEVRSSDRGGKMKTEAVLLVFVLGALGQCIPAFAYDWSTNSGTGDPNNPYQISTAEQLISIGLNDVLMSKCFVLTDDINLTPALPGNVVFNRALIARDMYTNDWSFDGTAFTGVFDGNNHKIIGLTVIKAERLGGYLGLFGYIGENGRIKDLNLENASINTYWWGGVLAGLSYGSISNCSVTGDVFGVDIGGLVGFNEGTIFGCDADVISDGYWHVGGLVGYNKAGSTISHCTSNGQVYGDSSDVGGLVGKNYGSISNCRATGDVTWIGSGQYDSGYGGLIGGNEGVVSFCSATGNVSGKGGVGGLVGSCRKGTVGSEKVVVSTSYATGNVSGNTSVGGLIGSTSEATVSNCYATGPVEGNDYVGGLVGSGNYHGDITNCYAAGNINSTGENIGGFIGRNGYDGEVLGCFWDADVQTYGVIDSIGTDVGDVADVYGLSTGAMCDPNTFLDAGWDFVGETINGPNDIWTIWEGAYYPRLAWENPLSGDFSIDKTWMYQNVLTSENSKLTADVFITDDPLSNSSYTYDWEIILPDDVTIAPTITAGGGFSDPCCTFAAPSCNEPDGISDSGQSFTIRVTVTGEDHGNIGIAEAEFGIALLGDANNDGVVNVADRSIVNAFWRLGAAGPFTFDDCNVNGDTAVNVADRSIANAVWRGVLGQNSVSAPCPFR